MRFAMPSFTASVVCCLAVMASVTAAQAAPSGTPASQGTNSVARGPQPDASAPAKPDDPAKVAAAREFIVAYHPRTDPLNMAANIDRMMPNMIRAAKRDNPKLDVKKFAHERRAQLMKQSEEMLDRQAHVVSRHFSMDELKQLIAFFHSPLGRKLNDESPKIQKDLMELRRPPMQKITVKPSDGDDDDKDSKGTTLYKTGSETHDK